MTKNWFVGGYALNPTYVKFDDDTTAANLPRWSFTSGLELGVAF